MMACIRLWHFEPWVTHRFTAIYRLDKTDLEMVELEWAKMTHQRPPLCPESHFRKQSFCELVVHTTNSALDKA
jgi:hypothetical protein